MYRRWIFLATAAGLLAAGCGDTSSPEGAASTVAIRAFIDADGSGAFGSGDVPLANRAVTLQATSGAPAFSATTDAQGVASFADVPPGSYAAALTGNPPAGAVLASAQGPVVVAPFGGAAVAGEFRFVYLPGSISGTLFRDNNGNGTFDAGIDTPAPGLPVALLGATGTQVVATTTTSATGVFSFARLRPGPYRVVITPLPTMQIVEGDTIAVTVGPQAPVPVPVRFTGSLISTIGAVRAAAFADSAGTRFDPFTVEGVVYAAQGTFRTDNAYIQDATGGILLFNVPAAANLAAGDSVRVTAALDWFNGELELARFSSTSPPVIDKLGTGTVRPARTVSGAEILSRAYEGQLVQLANAVVDSATTPNSSGAYTVYVSAADGSDLQVRIEKTAIGIPASYWVVGRPYSVSGALSHFRGVPQIKPRGPTDVRAGIATIAEAEALPAGTTVTVEGVVTAPVGLFGAATGSSTNAYIADATGGIQIFGVPATPTLELGDLVRVTGVTGAFSGELQIMRFSSSNLLQIVELGTAPVPAPRVVTGAEVAARTYEGELVSLPGVTVTAVGTPTSSGGYNVTVTAADGTSVTVRHDRTAIGIPSTFFQVGAVYDVTGILTAFNSAPQLKVRGAGDVVRK